MKIKNNTVKIILLLLSGAMIPIIITGAVYIYLSNAFEAMEEDFEWSNETRNILFEEYSPDKKYKLGVYNYDIGALGYSSVQASIIESQEEYPIYGNILPYQYVKSATWDSNETAAIIISRENKFNSKVVVNLK